MRCDRRESIEDLTIARQPPDSGPLSPRSLPPPFLIDQLTSRWTLGRGGGRCALHSAGHLDIASATCRLTISIGITSAQLRTVEYLVEPSRTDRAGGGRAASSGALEQVDIRPLGHPQPIFLLRCRPEGVRADPSLFSLFFLSLVSGLILAGQLAWLVQKIDQSRLLANQTNPERPALT